LQYAYAKTTVVYKVKENVGLAGLIGQSAIFLAATKGIPLAARCDASVLITGETGTGKEIFARAVHYLSSRAQKPFNPVNCGAIPLDLVENELFGHVGGAFTGASAARAGLIAETEGGTLFLDEIDCLPLLAQVKLLRFLQEKEYRPLGCAHVQRADVRIIAASNIDVGDAVRKGKLRQDFYYRLNVFPIDLPPLRERREDIPLLARHFLEKYAGEFNKQVTDFDTVSMRMLMQCDWPGNVRELEHIVQRAVVLSEEAVVQPSAILLSRSAIAPAGTSFRQAKAQVIEQFEKTYLENLLVEHSGNISKAARAAQKNRRAFFELLRKYRIQRQAPIKAKGQQAS
jgi:transcriptional regulator with PAS, ATPase and Fis domain